MVLEEARAVHYQLRAPDSVSGVSAAVQHGLQQMSLAVASMVVDERNMGVDALLHAHKHRLDNRGCRG